jgi:hypothetical protein
MVRTGEPIRFDRSYEPEVERATYAEQDASACPKADTGPRESNQWADHQSQYEIVSWGEVCS